MPRIICRYEVCVFNKKSRCTAEEIEYDPDQGCLTAQTREEFAGVVDDEDELDDEEDLKADGEDSELDDDELGDDLDEDEDDLFEDDEEEEDEDEAEDTRPARQRL